MDGLYRLSSIMGLCSFVVVTLIILSNQGFALLGVNEEPSLFDRISLVNATVVYNVPGIPTLSTWMMALLGVMLLGAGIVFRKRFVKS